MSRIRRMLALSITLVTAFLCVFTSINMVHAEETSPAIERIRFQTGVTTIENVDVEYTVTGGLVESIHIDTPKFYVNAGTNSGYHINANNIKLKTDNGLITNYANVSIVPNSGATWTVQANGIDVNGNDITYSAQVENLHVTYDIVQHIFIGFNQPVFGYCQCDFTVKSGRHYNLSTPTDRSGAYVSGNKMTFRSYGSSVIVVDLVETHFDETSFPSTSNNPMVTFDNSTWVQDNLVPYEEPVKDVTSHNLLSSILDLLNNNSGTSSTNNAINDATSDLVDQGDLMHGTEVNLQNAMDSALSDQALSLDINQKIQSDSKVSSSFNWVGTQLTNIVQGFNDITPYWEFMFIMPLVLGIGLLIIGRLR